MLRLLSHGPRFIRCLPFLLVGLAASNSSAQTVTIPDPALEQLIRSVVEVPTGSVTVSDLQKIVFLDASNRGISNLSGLQSASNLIDLRINNNFITSLQPISALPNLVRLRVQNNDLDVTIGSFDRSIIDNFITNGVEVIFEPQGPAGLTILGQPESLELSVGETAEFEVVMVGSGPFTYQWIRNDTVLPNQTNRTLRVANLRLGDAGTYQVRVALASQPSIEVLSEPATLAVVPPETAVTIPDANLSGALRAVLGLTPTAPITQRALFGLRRLDLADRAIVDLQGLNFAVNLTSLNLADNFVLSIAPLAGLVNLETLDLEGNLLDLSPGSPDLSIINDFRLRGTTVRADNQRARLTIVATPVDQFTIPGGQAAFSVRAVSAGPITYQWLRNGSPIAGANAAILRIPNVRADDAGSYAVTVSSLGQELTTTAAQLTLSTLSEAPVFEDRNLERAVRRALGLRRGEEITAEVMRDLVMLDLSRRRIESLDGLEFAVNLMDLRLAENRISDLTPLRGLNNLIWLDLTRNRVADVSPLSGLQNLAWLYLDRNFIRDISPLTSLINLVELRVRQNFVDARPNRPAVLSAQTLSERGTQVRWLPQGTAPRTDFDGDGIGDLIFFNAAKFAARAWILNGDGGVLEDLDIGLANQGWEVSLVGDLTGNQIADILWFNPTTRQVGAFLSEGAEVGISWQFFGLAPEGYEPRFSFDLNDSGFPDLVWYNPQTGEVAIWFQFASGYDQDPYLLGRADTKWKPVAFDRFDDAGRPGLLWHNAAEGQVSVWFLRANTTIQSWDIIGVTSPDWIPFGVTDFDSDGRNDIGFFRPSTGEVAAMILGPTGSATFFLGIGAVEAGWEPVALVDAYADGNTDIIFSRFERPTPVTEFRLRRPPSDRIGILKLDGQGNALEWKALRLIESDWRLVSP